MESYHHHICTEILLCRKYRLSIPIFKILCIFCRDFGFATYYPPVNLENEQTFGISDVARRTGLNQSTIRMWEARYQAVEPFRTQTNRRLYREQDIERFILLRSLTQKGNSISSIANLELDDLRKRLIGDEMAAPVPGVRNRVLTVGAGVGEVVTSERVPELEIIGHFGSCSLASEQSDLKTDLMVVELGTLFPELVAEIRQLIQHTGAERSIVVYHFASTKTATGLARAIPGLILFKAPVGGDQLRRECLVQLSVLNATEAVVPIDAGPIAPHLYNQEQLAKLAEISTTVECECPQHLAGLLQSLTAFESYSMECEDRNPQDALLHAFLHRTTAKARRTMEEALQHLVRVEGITVT